MEKMLCVACNYECLRNKNEVVHSRRGHEWRKYNVLDFFICSLCELGVSLQ